jgi:flavorubredoxin
MWHSTESIANAIRDSFEDAEVPAHMKNLQSIHISDVMTDVLDAKYICVGSPTLNNGMLPTVAAFLTYMKGLAPKNRIGLAFGSYGWGGQSIGQIDEMLKSSGFKTLNPVKAQWVPDEDTLKAITEKVKGGLK